MHATSSTAIRPPGIAYLALGDSLAEGTGATDPATLGYVPRLFRFFRARSRVGADSLINLGTGGATSESFITGDQLGAALDVIGGPEITTGVVTFDIGGNDFLNLLNTEPCLSDPTSAESYKAVMETIRAFARNYSYSVRMLVSALAKTPGPPRLLVMTYYNPWSGTGDPIADTVDLALGGGGAAADSMDAATPPAALGINGIIVQVARTFDLPVANVYPRFAGKGPLLTHITEMDIHPNDAGHAQIAMAFEEAYLAGAPRLGEVGQLTR